MTRCALHGQEQCPLCGAPPPPPDPRRRPAAPADNMAVDAAGTPLPYSPEEVRQIVEKALREGDVMAAILRLPTGDLCVQVLGPPSQELVEILQTTLDAYKRVLKGH
jgi:hypothetical protein